ncbi:gp436 family protein [Photobacterium sanguinicancri]|uniref:gp436 family protein n=1 Tax=Photobacterium sanguinicancri TaxID=875932 RepID=UPI0026E20851|nr:DUF1320 domain-containing protein [Photobacterium sanguinicancri]MDO6497328.1 DUF1320 domain-containing protein [Photobacterium sanguinicancri]
MYCDKKDMNDRFGKQELIELTDRDGSAGDIVEDVLNQAIDDASSTIDGYLGGRYSLPLSVVPRILTRHACDLARYFLYDNALDDASTPAKRYHSSIKYLEQAANGKVQLGLDTKQQKAATTATAEMYSAGSVFSRKQAKGFI